MSAFLALGDVTNALRLVEAQLTKTPDDPASLNSQAAILVQCGRAAEALPILDHVLALTNLPLARINRAFLRLDRKDFAMAERDLRELEKAGTAPGLVNFGLAVLAEQRQDTNQAVRLLRLCLTNAATGTPLWRQASSRLQTLEPPAAK